MARTSTLGGSSKTALIPGWTISTDYSASNYYPSTIPGAVYADGVSALVADYVIYLPFVPRFTHTFTKLSFYNSGTGDNAKKLRLGLYNSAAGRPTSNIVDGGELTLSGAAALNEATISQSLVAGTLYFMAATASASISGYRIGATSLIPRIVDALIDLGSPSATILPVNVGVGYAESRAYAALPANAGTLLNTTPSVTTNNPLVWIKG